MRVRPISIVVLALVTCYASIGPCQQPSYKMLKTQLLYRNAEYGFCLALPAGWSGFHVLTERWGGDGNGESESGPRLVVRNPRWTKEKPYQDIPILVFTSAQWRSVDSGEFSVSAAPIGPSELGRNRKYVFALPPRFAGFDDATGTDEVLRLLQQKPFQAPCSRQKPQ
ncbi:MAG: hypothetical protein WBQ95_05280 [Terracidiphilus sp.]